MNGNENPSGPTPEPDRWGFGERLASLQTAALLSLDFLGDEGFLRSEGNIVLFDFRTSTKKLHLCYWVMKGPWAGFFFKSSKALPVHRMELEQEVDVFPRTVSLRIKFLSIKLTLIHSRELGNEIRQLWAIFLVFPSHLFTTFFAAMWFIQ